MMQAALWMIWKSAGESKASVVLPIAIFGAHALLGNQWNGKGAPVTMAKMISVTAALAFSKVLGV